LPRRVRTPGAAGTSVGAANRERSEVLAHDGLVLAARDKIGVSEQLEPLEAANAEERRRKRRLGAVFACSGVKMCRSTYARIFV